MIVKQNLSKYHFCNSFVTRKNYITVEFLNFGLKMTENDGPTFCRRMRDATKAIHDTSDKLVNLKLGLSMSNDMVWANGLLVFAKVCKIHQFILL